MDDVYRLEAKGLARAKVRSKRRRVQTIRRRTIRGSLALFAISWAIIFGQLVTGNDPALSRSSHGGRKLLASTHQAPRRATATPSPRPQASDDESTPVSVSPPPVSDSAPSPTVTVAPPPAPAPAPVIVAPPPAPAPVITSAS